MAPPIIQDISDDLTNCFAQLICQPQISENLAVQQKSYVTYIAPMNGTGVPEITLLEARSLLVSSGDTGLRTWDAALYLGEYLFSCAGKRIVAGSKIIELGAGTGFLSILCAKHLGALHVLATDGSGEVINDLESNLYLNGLHGNPIIETAVLNWGQALIDSMPDDVQDSQFYDLVLAADVVSSGFISSRFHLRLSYEA